MASSEDPIVASLREFTTCDVADALCKLNHRNGGFLSGLTMWSPARQDGPTKIVGPAYTVKYVALDDPAPKHPTHYIDSVPRGAVIFVSCPPRVPNAVYGGLMSARARARGAEGAVVDGRFRDLQEQREAAFPVFARDVGTSPPYELVKVAAVDVPVELQGSEHLGQGGGGGGGEGAAAAAVPVINPGDYIVADLNGVVCLPRGLAAQALPLMRRQVEADGKMAEAIRGGMGFAEASKKFR